MKEYLLVILGTLAYTIRQSKMGFDVTVEYLDSISDEIAISKGGAV